MKKPTKIKHPAVLISFLCSLLLLSCTKTSKSEMETMVGDYKIPETIPLQFTEPEPFEWETISSDTLTTPVTYSLDVDALPSKPFELNTFKPLKTPMKEYDLDWDSFPTEQLKFDSVPFTVSTAPIKKPTITKMKPPGVMKGTDVNLLQLSTNEGLPTNDITSFLETEDGSVWIGSTMSTTPLTYYDGENAFVYDYPGVYKMTFDQEGKLWLVSPGPRLLTVLDFKNDIAYTITKTDSFRPFDILCDRTGTLYMAFLNEGFYAMDSKMKSLQRIANERSNRPWRLLEDRNDNLWLGFKDGMKVLDKDRKALTTLPRLADLDMNSEVRDIEKAQDGAVWLSLPDPSQANNITSSSLLRLSLKEGIVNVLDAENGYNNKGTEIAEDKQGNLWILGAKEVFILGKNRNRYKTIVLNSTLQASLKIPRPLRMKDGSLWIATTDKGVVIANDFTLKTEYFDTSKGLINDQVWQTEEDSRGHLWLGTIDGINIIDPKTNTIRALSHELLHSTNKNTILSIEEVSKDVFFIDAVSGFSILNRQKNTLTKYASDKNLNFRVWDVEFMDDHTFLMTTESGVFIYDTEKNTLKKITSKNDPEILKSGSQSIMHYDQKEILWLPTQNGLAKINLITNTVSYLREEQGLCDNRTFVATFSKEGELWLATMNGIGILNLKENTLTNLKEENGLLPAEMYDLIERDTLMYAASVNGLIPIEKSSVKNANRGYYNFNRGSGFMATDYLEGSARFLKNGQFWAGVTNTSNEFRLLVLDAAPRADTTTAIVGITSLFVMDEDPGFQENSSIDSLNNKVISYAVTKQMKWDSITLPYAIPKGLELPYDQNSLSFSYGSGDLFNREKLTYRFILDGEDKDWTYAATTTKTKNYYNLKPGHYTFKVSARSFSNTWSSPAKLTFDINPPWWQTWWAYLLFAFIFSGVVWSVVAYRSRWLQKENKILEERVSHRTAQLKHKIDELKETQSQLIQSEKMASLGELTAGIAHEIQNPLNFVNNFSEVSNEMIQEIEEERAKKQEARDETLVSEILRDVKQNLEKITHHGKRADAIVKGMLAHSRSSSGEKVPTDINALADEYLRLSYHGLRARDKSFNADFKTDFDPDLPKLNVVPQDIGRVLLNLINNAFQAVATKALAKDESFKPLVTVTTKQTNKGLQITVTDNGSGIPDAIKDKIFQPFFTTKPSGQGTGLGLSLSYDIVKAHGGEISVESAQGKGTAFTIQIPIS